MLHTLLMDTCFEFESTNVDYQIIDGVLERQKGPQETRKQGHPKTQWGDDINRQLGPSLSQY